MADGGVDAVLEWKGQPDMKNRGGNVSVVTSRNQCQMHAGKICLKTHPSVIAGLLASWMPPNVLSLR